MVEIKSIREFVFQTCINIGTNLSPEILFSEFGDVRELSIARGLVPEKFIFYIGLIYVFLSKKIKPNIKFMLIIIILGCVLPAAITTNEPHTLRSSGLILLIPLIVVIGAKELFITFETFFESKNWHFYLKTGLVALFLLVEVGYTYANIQKYNSDKALRNFGEGNYFSMILTKKMNTYKYAFNKIYVTDIMNEGYIYVSSFCNYTPEENLLTVKKYDKSGEFDKFYQYGKFYFLNDTLIPETKTSPILFITDKKIDMLPKIDSIIYLNSKAFFYVVKKKGT